PAAAPPHTLDRRGRTPRRTLLSSNSAPSPPGDKSAGEPLTVIDAVQAAQVRTFAGSDACKEQRLDNLIAEEAICAEQNHCNGGKKTILDFTQSLHRDHSAAPQKP